MEECRLQFATGEVAGRDLKNIGFSFSIHGLGCLAELPMAF